MESEDQQGVIRAPAKTVVPWSKPLLIAVAFNQVGPCLAFLKSPAMRMTARSERGEMLSVLQELGGKEP